MIPVTEIEEWLEIEKIKKVRVLYSHYFDSNELDSLAELFTEDIICEFGVHGTWFGKKQLRQNYQRAHAEMDKLNKEWKSVAERACKSVGVATEKCVIDVPNRTISTTK